MENKRIRLLLLLIPIGMIIGFSIGYNIPIGKIQKQNDEINNLNTQITGYNEQIYAFQETLVNINEQISSLDIEMDELDAQIQELLLELNRKESQIQNLQKFVPPFETLAPNFTIKGIDGESFTLSDHLGEFVLIQFMATWCSHCGNQVLEYSILNEKFDEQIVIISISLDSPSVNEEQLRNYKARYDAPGIWALDTVNVTDSYNVKRIPTTFIIDKNGYIWAQYIGFTNSATLVKEFEQLQSYWGSYLVPVKFVTISALDANELIDSNQNIIILDVRTDTEFGEEHIEKAINIPVQELLDKIGELDKNSIILVYCRTGIISAQASEILADNGFTNIYNMDSGISAWKNEHLPIVIIP